MSNNKAIESLKQFAEQHGEIKFACLCDAALAGDEWAKDRVIEALEMVYEITSEPPGVYDTRNTLEIIRETDCTRPDGTIARGQVTPVTPTAPDWNTWILASNLARVASAQRADERDADEQTTELLATIAKEWRGLVRVYGGIDSPARCTAYTAWRIAEVRTVLRRDYMHHPACRAYDEALEAVELELGIG